MRNKGIINGKGMIKGIVKDLFVEGLRHYRGIIESPSPLWWREGRDTMGGAQNAQRTTNIHREKRNKYVYIHLRIHNMWQNLDLIPRICACCCKFRAAALVLRRLAPTVNRALLSKTPSSIGLLLRNFV